MRGMRHIPIFLTLCILVAGLTGCRNKSQLELYEPGEIQTWRTVENEAMRESAQERPRVEIKTNRGTFVLELFEQESPVTVANFLRYVNDAFYDGTIFHRVEPGLVIQGGGFTMSMTRKPTMDPIENEAGNGLRNLRGTVGAARTRDMDSANSQFYINLVDNPGFNGDGVTGGYAVFGRVYEGMDVVDAIALVETSTQDGLRNVPDDPVIVLSARRIN